MNKTAIRKFAEWAREKLIADITYKASTLGVTENGIAKPLPQSTQDLQFFDIGTKNFSEVQGTAIKQRDALVNTIKSREASFKTYKDAFESVVEEVAYTWFNRLVAIRFMEVNDYIPSGVRVLSSENKAKNEPDFVTTPFDTDLEFTPFEQDRVVQLKDENKLDELFRMLFIKQCNKLHEILPDLFESTEDYSELLLTISFTDTDGIVYHLVHDIDESDFDISENGSGQVEIIGWMYQYYISKKHDEIINIYKGTIKKSDIPAATQLFTTDWVVRYMVDNSLGRYWIERNPQSKLAEKLDFFVTPKDGNITYLNEKVSPTDLTFFDPCMGSGHILVYAFDVLMEIYRECGYSDRDAAVSIVENNLFGLDIDKRAYQLAYFAVMMKARSFNRRALTREITNNLAAIEESNEITRFHCDNLTTDKEKNKIGEYLLDTYRHAKEIGSLQTVEVRDYDAFSEYLSNIKGHGQLDIFSAEWFSRTYPIMIRLTKQAKIMSKKFAVVCTNPPYMNKMEGNLKDFVVNEYKAYSGDLFSVFMYRNFGFCKPDGYSAFMTPFVWMFIKTYEQLRTYIIENKAITSLVQMEYSAFEEATVPICSFVLKNGKPSEKTLCFRLSEFKGGMEIQKQKVLEALSNKNCGYFYEADQSNFSKIPGSPVAYWASNNIIDAFSNEKLLNDISSVKIGMGTGKNEIFVRQWWEVIGNEMDLTMTSVADLETSRGKWFPYNKGGEYRLWYGNLQEVLWYNTQGRAKMKTMSGHRENGGYDYYFKKGITWTFISSSKFGVRYRPYGSAFDVAGSTLFTDEYYFNYVLAFLSSNVCNYILKMLNPTLNYQAGNIKSLPIKVGEKELVSNIAEQCVNTSQTDWDSFETSWDFKKHPMLPKLATGSECVFVDSDGKLGSISVSDYRIAGTYAEWEAECNARFNQLKANEEELNRIFIDIYGLQDELTPEVEDKDVTVRKADLKRDIRSLVSYAVGCMFGRYSLDVDGLAYAGGRFSVKLNESEELGVRSEELEVPYVEIDGKLYHKSILQTQHSKLQTEKKLQIPNSKLFSPDLDNCIPITDEAYFEDDIVGRFVEFIRVVYGEKTLEENLAFIANALGNKGTTSRDVIRNYFLNDFMADHIKIYQKRPIYWLFDSGKQNGFKALCYMHRWNADTTGNMRVEYLHRMQRVYEKEIERMQDTIDNSRDSKEVSAASKRKEKLQKQLKETKEFDAKVAHLALSRIDIDLDDGVKVNYEKVQTAPDGKKMQILFKL